MTELIGSLNDQYLTRSRPLGASRVLWEISDDGTNVRDLRSRLSLDSGYLSRLLRKLEADGLVEVRRSEHDSRVRTARLTPDGTAERRLLDRRSDDLARSLIAPLTERQRSRLVEAASTVERLLTAALVRVGIEKPASSDGQYCIGQYFNELDRRFDDGFDPALSISADVNELIDPAGVLLVARLRDEPIGCQSARGLGLGRRLLSELETIATERDTDTDTVRLETNKSLTEAINLYRSSGYTDGGGGDWEQCYEECVGGSG